MSQLNRHAIQAARLWAEQHAGEDTVLDVFEWKLLEHLREAAQRSSEHHARAESETKARMAELESTFATHHEEEF